MYFSLLCMKKIWRGNLGIAKQDFEFLRMPILTGFLHFLRSSSELRKMSSLCESLPGKPKKNILYTIPQYFISGMAQGFGIFFFKKLWLFSLLPYLGTPPRLLPSQMRKMKKKSPNKRSFSPPPYFSLNRRDTPKYRKKSLFWGLECVCQISFWIISRDFPWKKRGKVCGKSRAHFRFFLKKTNIQKISKANFCTQRDDSPANWKIMLISCMHILVTHVRVTRAVFHISFSSLLACFGRAQKRRGGGESASKVKNGPPPILSSPLSSSFACVCGDSCVVLPPAAVRRKKVFLRGRPELLATPQNGGPVG